MSDHELLALPDLGKASVAQLRDLRVRRFEPSRRLRRPGGTAFARIFLAEVTAGTLPAEISGCSTQPSKRARRILPRRRRVLRALTPQPGFPKPSGPPNRNISPWCIRWLLMQESSSGRLFPTQLRDLLTGPADAAFDCADRKIERLS